MNLHQKKTSQKIEYTVHSPLIFKCVPKIKFQIVINFQITSSGLMTIALKHALICNLMFSKSSHGYGQADGQCIKCAQVDYN